MYSDQPTRPSSVVILRNELTRQPASQCRSSILTIFIAVVLTASTREMPRHCEECSDEAISTSRACLARDCFAALAMTSNRLDASCAGRAPRLNTLDLLPIAANFDRSNRPI